MRSTYVEKARGVLREGAAFALDLAGQIDQRATELDVPQEAPPLLLLGFGLQGGEEGGVGGALARRRWC